MVWHIWPGYLILLTVKYQELERILLSAPNSYKTVLPEPPVAKA